VSLVPIERRSRLAVYRHVRWIVPRAADDVAPIVGRIPDPLLHVAREAVGTVRAEIFELGLRDSRFAVEIRRRRTAWPNNTFPVARFQ
jgi:hypothetical protein